ncbi:hypothetical protein DICVIV_13205 [Dictyocaulus viviparus]|uniref:Senescence-associated protein n=1 Tax=Dictyocaulus viviparus TaxID=29172 RepID=A0A0D8X8E2_DICVI|nr:hypothetical protein DICVIV_13205 [Dictyocaulus viviparus]
MIGRADTEGSKSNVAVDAWLPQARYPCGNFSATSYQNLSGLEGLISHAFASTGQKSETVNVRRDHVSSVLIRQLDSPSQYQFQFDRYNGRSGYLI